MPNKIPGKKPFSTFVVGSLPRPQWVRELIEDRKRGEISEADADALLDSVVPSAIRMQERAGLDFVSDGEWRRESYVKVFTEAVGGFKSDLIDGGGSQFSSLMYPAVVSRLEPVRPIAADEARFLRDHARGLRARRPRGNTSRRAQDEPITTARPRPQSSAWLRSRAVASAPPP